MTNIAKLLKDAPKGMKLYSPLFGEVEYMQLGDENKVWVKTSCGTYCFDKYGKPYAFDKAECLLFPSKDCRTWEEWKLPVKFKFKFKVGDWLYRNTRGVLPILVKDYSETQGYKVECERSTYYLQKGVVENDYHLWTIEDAKDGDVLVCESGWTCIFKTLVNDENFSSYCFMDSTKWFCEEGSECHTLNKEFMKAYNGEIKPATKEQRDILFTKMKEAGYKWDSEKKELHKIQPHYAIANFHAGMPVLVRDGEEFKWLYTIFGIYNKDNLVYPFVVVNMRGYAQCIPFEGNEALLGTTDMPSEEYINW